MSNYNDYRHASIDFRRLFSNVLRMDSSEGVLPLIRLKNFIDSNEIISEIVRNAISHSDYDYKSNFVINDGNSSWKMFNIPIDTYDHIKAMYEYLNELCTSYTELVGISFGFTYTASKKTFNDRIQIFLEKAFKPLGDYISDSLAKEMLLLEGEKMPTHITQNIDKNYGTANLSNGNINSVNTTNVNTTSEILEIVEKLIELIAKQDIDSNEKESVIDDLEIIKEQINSSEPKPQRLKKAVQGIYTVLQKTPALLSLFTQITINSQNLFDKVNQFIEKLS